VATRVPGNGAGVDTGAAAVVVSTGALASPEDAAFFFDFVVDFFFVPAFFEDAEEGVVPLPFAGAA
jgi:hypothetical protein